MHLWTTPWLRRAATRASWRRTACLCKRHGGAPPCRRLWCRGMTRWPSWPPSCARCLARPCAPASPCLCACWMTPPRRAPRRRARKWRVASQARAGRGGGRWGGLWFFCCCCCCAHLLLLLLRAVGAAGARSLPTQYATQAPWSIPHTHTHPHLPAHTHTHTPRRHWRHSLCLRVGAALAGERRHALHHRRADGPVWPWR